MPRRPGTSASKGASMSDVARLAGVSGQTVSRVVNGREGVSPRTRQHVEGAMTRLGYHANAAARALATGHFRTIGVATFNPSAVGNIRIIDAIVPNAQARGYAVQLAVVDTPTQQDIRAAMRGMTDRAVDGIVLIEARVLDDPNLHLPQDVPVVVADSSGSHDHPTFGMDEAAGARAAVGHLLDLGHNTVHHVAGPTGSNPATRRRAAWQRMLRRHDRSVPTPVVGNWTPESGYEAGLKLLHRKSVTAVFAANDQMAAGVLHAAHEMGRRVPEDLSVIGYDDIDIAAHLVPPLTTVAQDLGAVGRLCLDRLLERIDSEDRAHAVATSTTSFPRRQPAKLVKPELVVRRSTAPPRA